MAESLKQPDRELHAGQLDRPKLHGSHGYAAVSQTPRSLDDSQSASGAEGSIPRPTPMSADDPLLPSRRSALRPKELRGRTKISMPDQALANASSPA